MIKTNLIRKIDDCGRVIIPKKIINKIDTNNYLALFVKNNYFILKNTNRCNANIKIDAQNRICIYSDFRDKFNIKSANKLEFYIEGNNIIMKKYNEENVTPLKQNLSDEKILNLLEQIIA
jgi:bifunctional DNA-binding transcriptional regulator/antitoxin component of YhaV-PrlF toxin-antitoxin module